MWRTRFDESVEQRVSAVWTCLRRITRNRRGSWHHCEHWGTVLEPGLHRGTDSHARTAKAVSFHSGKQDVLFGLWRTQSLQLMPAGVGETFRVTHPYHPLFGREYKLVTYATAGEAIASISTTTQGNCGRSLPVGPTLWRTTSVCGCGCRAIRIPCGPICSRSPT